MSGLKGPSVTREPQELCRDFDVASVFAFREVCPEELRVEAPHPL